MLDIGIDIGGTCTHVVCRFADSHNKNDKTHCHCEEHSDDAISVNHGGDCRGPAGLAMTRFIWKRAFGNSMIGALRLIAPSGNNQERV